MLIRTERVRSALVVSLNRPEVGNAINRELALELKQCVASCAAEPEVRVLVITGTGPRFFCTGGDVKAYRAIASPEELNEVFGLMREVCDSLERFPCPVIAAVNGYAIGGGAEFMLACDFRIADQSATIGFPQSRLGILPGWDGTSRLLRMVGRATAARLLLSGKPVSASEAVSLGLIDEVVDGGTALVRAIEFAETLCEAAPLSLRAIKQAMLDSYAESPASGRVNARASFASLWFSQDHREAERAFMEKRAPRFTGR